MKDPEHINERRRESEGFIAIKAGELQVVCPVCGGKISSEHLPDTHNITNEIYFSKVFQLCNSTVLMKWKFPHVYNEEEGIPLDELHDIEALLEAEFDSTGACSTFKIVEIKPFCGHHLISV